MVVVGAAVVVGGAVVGAEVGDVLSIGAGADVGDVSSMGAGGAVEGAVGRRVVVVVAARLGGGGGVGATDGAASVVEGVQMVTSAARPRSRRAIPSEPAPFVAVVAAVVAAMVSAPAATSAESAARCDHPTVTNSPA